MSFQTYRKIALEIRTAAAEDGIGWADAMTYIRSHLGDLVKPSLSPSFPKQNPIATRAEYAQDRLREQFRLKAKNDHRPHLAAAEKAGVRDLSDYRRRIELKRGDAA